MPSEPANIDREHLAARALELRYRNFNCAQAVACALAPLVAADEDLCFRASEAFGGGMGGHTETCGAISGGALVLGLASSNGSGDPTSKEATYALIARLVDRFREQNGSTICAELRGEPAGTPLRSCDGCIEDALLQTLDLLEELRARPA